VNGGVFVGSPLPLLLWVLDVALPPPKRRLWGWRHGTDWLGTQPPWTSYHTRRGGGG